MCDGVVVVGAAHVGGTWGSSIVSSAADVEIRGLVWALPILWEQGKCWACVCVLVV